MKSQLLVAVGFILFFCSCKKENAKDDQEEKLQEIVSKYHLTLANEISKSPYSKNFKSPAELESYLKASSVLSNSVSINVKDTAANSAELAKRMKILDLAEGDGTADGADAYGDGYHLYTINFQELKDSGYASIAAFGIMTDMVGIKLTDFSIYTDGSTFGTFYYTNHNISSTYQVNSLDATVTGVYQEILTVGGITTYYRNYKSTFTATYNHASSLYIYCTLKYESI